MSRSYKKTPIYKDGYGDKSLKWYKRTANKKVRRTSAIYSGKAYRKVYDTWDFRDYFFRKTLNEYKIELEREFKSFFNTNGKIEELSKYQIKEYNDKSFKLWKKIYYWK